jgi:uncharacterized protein with HEPN domain
MATDKTSVIYLKSNLNVQIIGATTQIVKDGKFRFEKLIFKGKINTTQIVYLQSPSIDYDFVSRMTRKNITETIFNIKFRKCIEGEQEINSECNFCLQG